MPRKNPTPCRGDDQRAGEDLWGTAGLAGGTVAPARVVDANTKAICWRATVLLYRAEIHASVSAIAATSLPTSPSAPSFAAPARKNNQYPILRL